MKFVASAQKRVADGYYNIEGTPLAPNGAMGDGLIAELKPRSPSDGRLLIGDAAELLEAYRHADAISVLVDPDHFDGSISLFRQAHKSGKPLLWKDFVLDEAQVVCAAHNGASAILLIERILTPGVRESLVQAAHALGLQVLLEIFSEGDWETAKESRADFIGVNARDLSTLKLDQQAALQLIGIATAHGPVWALSGIKDRRDRMAAEALGAEAVLVGTHLMTAPSPELAVKALQRPIAKICGITNALDLHAAVAAGADLVGFVVGADTPRSIPIIKAQQLADEAKVPTVLVTPHEDDWEVREWCRVVKPTFVQLHALSPSPEWEHSLKAIPTHVLQAHHADPFGVGVVMDTGSGGTGKMHDWATDLETALARKVQLSLVAGGLDASNAAKAIWESGAWGADASSRLEATPGRKDHVKMKQFIEAVHGT